MKLITVMSHDNYVSLPAFFNWYNNKLLPLIRQFFLIPNRINKFAVVKIPHAVCEVGCCENANETSRELVFRVSI
jgi:hypothetical protein